MMFLRNPNCTVLVYRLREYPLFWVIVWHSHDRMASSCCGLILYPVRCESRWLFGILCSYNEMELEMCLFVQFPPSPFIWFINRPLSIVAVIRPKCVHDPDASDFHHNYISRELTWAATVHPQWRFPLSALSGS